ncbi:MAG TPA: hypothetical protein VKG44_10580, partial [Candidatus Baltobacteraceae bacterium]|nr:hypothetical protein [Candidatus Baltobacteraceae bacterium]
MVASFVLLAASVALAPSGTAQTVQKFTANIAYDQVGRLLWHATPPPPTSFAEDAARIAALPSDKDVPNANAIYSTAEAMQAMGSNPLTGMAVPAMAMAYNAQIAAYNAKMTAMSAAFQKAGAMSHDSFYRGWSRFDNPRLQSATILKPDQGLEIALDLAKRTYREKRAAPRTGLSVETYVVSSAEELTITFGSEPVVKALGPLTLAGLPARGYQTDATFMLSGNYGLCS